MPEAEAARSEIARELDAASTTCEDNRPDVFLAHDLAGYA